MKDEAEKIIALYQQEYSAPQIAQKLSLHLSCIYRILKKHGVTRRSASHQNSIRFKNKPLSYNFREKLSSEEQKLLVSALMLYLGEGAKGGTTVDFTNSTPSILKVFINFLRKICCVDENKLRFYLYCFSDQNPNELINFWAEQLNVRSSSFTKPYIRENAPNKNRKMPWGVLHIRYNDKRLLEKILSLCSNLVAQLTT